MRIKEEGMPKYGMASEFGDLLVKFNVQSPETLTEEQRKQIALIF